MKKMLFVGVMVFLLACGDSPTAPSQQGTFGAQVPSGCAASPWRMTGVTISIDGSVVGTAIPGGAAVTKQVAIGSHAISGASIPAGYVWADNRTLTTSSPDFIVTFACATP